MFHFGQYSKRTRSRYVVVWNCGDSLRDMASSKLVCWKKQKQQQEDDDDEEVAEKKKDRRTRERENIEYENFDKKLIMMMLVGSI